MRRPQWSPNTLRAHEATIYAKSKGRDREFHHLVAGIYWGSGSDINDLSVLGVVAGSSGLDWADLEPRIETEEFRQTVMQQFQAARERGVEGTPTYEIGGELLKGDVSIDDLRDAIKSAAAD